MVFAMLAAAIAWNLGTWYFGIPASSSHTLIGSILGVGLANALITDLPLGDGVNWGKAIDIGLSVVSPVAGFLIAGGLLLALAGYRCRRCTRRPSNGANWTTRSTRRSGTACAGAVGDGREPRARLERWPEGHWPDHAGADRHRARQFRAGHQQHHLPDRAHRDAATHLSAFYHRNEATLAILALWRGGGASDLPPSFRCDPEPTLPTIAALQADLQGVSHYGDLPAAKRIDVRRYLLCLDDTAKKVARLKELPARERADLQRLRTDLTATTEYAPSAIVAVALALGAGTMVGWRRVPTVGEKIGKQGMTYAQGMSAQVTAMGAIGWPTSSACRCRPRTCCLGHRRHHDREQERPAGWHRAQHPAGLGADPARLDAAGRRPVLGRRRIAG